jgi:hypothetical protein
MACLAALTLLGCGPKEKDQNNGSEENNSSQNGATNGAPNGATNAGTTGTNGTTEPVTYYEHVKPIVDARCTECHVDGGIGPFALDSYEAVSSVKALVANVVETEVMPPFLYDDSCNEYEHDP